MGAKNRSKELDDYEVQLIKYKAKQMAGRNGFCKSDREDIQQELSIHVWLCLPKHDPSRASRHTFVSRVIDNYVRKLIDRNQAACRDYRKNKFSLDEELEYDNGFRTSRRDLIDLEDYLATTGRASCDIDLALDLQRAIEQLPDDQRDLCLKLFTDTKTEVAESMGKPRSSLYEDINKLKALLKSAGLKENL